MHGEVTILLADSNSLIREGIRAVLSSFKNITIVDEAKTGIEAYSLARKIKPDLLILDADLPVMNGHEAGRRVRVSVPRVQFIILSSRIDDNAVRESLRSGAAGFVVKDYAKSELLNAIRMVVARRLYYSPAVSTSLVEEISKRTAPYNLNKGVQSLTIREIEILSYISHGETNREIGQRLYRSSKTMDKHRQNIMKKLDIHTKEELIQFAKKNNIT